MKKAALWVVAFIIIYFSNVPNLYVSKPDTWFQKPHYESQVKATDVFNTEGEFWRPWSKEVSREFLLHKAGHVGAYGLLTICFYYSIQFHKRKGFWTWVCITLFAATDEFHQFFVVGRSGRIADILLDSAVSCIVLLCLYIAAKQRKKDPLPC